ncbi:hypothetical protein FC62_GL000918 [Amylolactobacillus amylotrophicus DSM 20534]|uniref:Uncharacterized protein n=2 Tax=Amylolactobacillus TaxID=2767876 RepID=A0A0R1YLJ2_9LACO|nr:hypothetical protein FC62_GL000918 [Amylolactobacillus amylotrophicus DSM 20534]KRM43223.1 hypothetical protein FD40_GL000235 [Amylolactobacillus amylophilus DSM 20533 = JCM 1125]GED80882.1 hypothetical protein LAM01_13550 [Amylolactobacillus amylophilus]
MFSKSDAELTKMGAVITTREIQQQPELWHETWSIYQVSITCAPDGHLAQKAENEVNNLLLLMPARVQTTRALL